MNLLLPRPLEDGRETADTLLSMGHEVIFAPVMERVDLEYSLPETAIKLIVATSGNAFRALKPHHVEELKSVPVCVSGAKTARIAGDLGFQTVTQVASRAEELETWLEAKGGNPEITLYLAGRERTLTLKGAVLVETYAMEQTNTLPAEAKKALEAGLVEGVLLYSKRMTELLYGLAPKNLNQPRTRFFCLSPEIATKARLLWPQAVTLSAAQPDEASLLSLLGN